MSAMVYTASGQVFHFGTEIGRGGEGTIFASPQNQLECAKIYTKPLPAAYVRKLELMVRNAPNDPAYASQKHHSIAWPSGLLYKDGTRRDCVGFLMARIDVTRFRKVLQYLDPADRAPGFTWKHLCVACRNIASSVAAVHEKGYCIGDVNESNILVAPTALITLIDCDSFQVPDPDSGKLHRCLVGKPEYTAPELQGKSYADVDRTVETDCFAMAVVMFQLLMEGTHPYQAKGRLVDDAPSSETKIVKGYFPYTMRGRDIAPPDHAPPFDVLSPALRGLFEKCFAEGNRNPDARPKASEWLQVIEKYWSTLKECALNGNHFFHRTSTPARGAKEPLRRVETRFQARLAYKSPLLTPHSR